MRKKWTAEEEIFLTDNYSKSTKNYLIQELKHSWSAIQQKAHILKLKRECSNANQFKLINETNESYYWLGFIMADGCFTKTKQIQINLGDKDINHLRKFAKFVEYKNEIIKPRISIDYSKIEEWLVKVFGILLNKTYNPCYLNKLNNDKFFSFIIGFIDGDGTIDNDGYLRIKCHSNWLNNLTEMIIFLTGNSSYSGKIIKGGEAWVCISKIEIMKQIKLKIISLNLPVLERKWERVNLEKLSKQEKSDKLQKICYKMFDKNLTHSDINKITNISMSQIYKQKKQYLEEIKKKDLTRENNRVLK